MKVRRIVNDYCTVKSLPQREVWQTLYQQHYYRYCRRPSTLPKESKLQAFVRLGLIESLYELAYELFVEDEVEVEVEA